MGINALARWGREWTLKAECRNQPQEWWYQEQAPEDQKAKEICRECPVRVTCLQYALDADEPWGIWGGFTTKERRRIRRGYLALDGSRIANGNAGSRSDTTG